MVDVDGNTPILSPGASSTGSLSSTSKLEELRSLLLDVSNQILGKLGQLRREILTILNSDHMQEKKIYCDTLIEISKVYLSLFYLVSIFIFAYLWICCVHSNSFF